MVLEKVASSPTVSSKGWTSLPSSDRKSEPFDLSEKGHPSIETIGSANKDSVFNFSHNKESNNNSTKAEFYIGDDRLVQSPTTETNDLFQKPTRTVKVQIKNADDGVVTKNKGPEFVPPDGGYGWVIAFSACAVNVFIVGFIKSYGVLYVSLMKKFPDATAYQASWLPVFLATTGLLIAPATGILCRKFTSRKVCFVGGIFAFTGILLGAFAKSMTGMIFTLGLFTGIGAGLITTPGVLITSLYFEKRRALASAICVSGNAIGGFIFPPLTEYLLSNYGLTGTLYIVAALQLHTCAASMFFRPIRLHALIQHKSKLKEKYIQNEESKNLVSPVDELEKLPTFSRQGSLLKKVIQKRLTSTSSSVEDAELHYQLSFLRSSSMMNSIPDLTQYARSWSNEQGGSLSQHPSFKTLCKGSKSSFANLIAGNKSNPDLEGECIVKDNKTNSLATMKVGESQPLTREFSKRTKNKMASLPELECDSQVSLSDIDNAVITQPLSEAADNMYTDRNLNINMTENFLETEPTEVNDTKSKLNESKCLSNCCSKFFDLSLFKSSTFWLISATVAFMATGAPHALFFLPAYAASVNVDQAAIIYLMSISSVIDLIGRLGSGFISDLKIIRSSFLYVGFGIAAGGALLLLPSVTSITEIGILLGLYGFGVGGWFVLIPTILAEHHGAQRLAASYGLVRMFHGIINFISPQVSGLLIDVSNNYKPIYYFMGSSMAFGGVLMLLEPFLVAAQNKKKSFCNV